MHIVRETLNDFIVYFKPTTRGGKIRLGVLTLILIAGGFFLLSDKEEPVAEAPEREAVSVRRADAFDDAASLSLIGTVEAVDQATIQSEVGGRVTSVRVEMGDVVRSGQVIATTENASEYASLLQAEGVYEAALAAAAQSDIGVTQAYTSLESTENAAVSAVRSAYTTANNAIHNYIDTFFTTPDAQFTPGLRLDGYGYTSYLNEERVALGSVLKQWRGEVDTLDVNDDLEGALTDARERTERVIEMVDTFIIILNDQEPPSAYTDAELASYSASFTSLRAELNATLLAIENARTSLQSAEEAVARAEIAGTGGAVSAADASVKQALGTLRSAQAAYARTILRTPVAGRVQTLNVRVGEHLAPMTVIAIVANQSDLLITTHVSAEESDRIEIGDAVRVGEAFGGTVSAIAPGVDPATGKVEVKIAIEESATLKNGETTRVEIVSGATEMNDEIRLPLHAFKMTPDGPVVFVVLNGVLEARPIELGEIVGDSVLVTGIDGATEIVTDARGLEVGTSVTVTNE